MPERPFPLNDSGPAQPPAGGNDWIIGPEETVLVTGAGGFIGPRVARVLLSYGFSRVRCMRRHFPADGRKKNLEDIIDSPPPGWQGGEIVEGNLLSPDDCRGAVEGVSVIYHLAAGAEKTFPGCFANSAVATRNLIEAALRAGSLKRFVNISSMACYSNEKIRRGGLLDESCETETPLKLAERHDPYAYGKAKQDEIVLEYARKKGLPYVFLRPGVVFGPGKAQITGRVGLDTFGFFLHLGLGNRIPFTYVDNCAEAIVLAGLRKGIDGAIINITDDDLPASGRFLSLYKKNVRRFASIPVPYAVFYLFCAFWEWYSEWSGGQLPPAFNRRKCAAYWKGNTYSNRKAKELLGWSPRVRMDEGLQRFFDYARQVKCPK